MANTLKLPSPHTTNKTSIFWDGLTFTECDNFWHRMPKKIVIHSQNNGRHGNTCHIDQHRKQSSPRKADGTLGTTLSKRLPGCECPLYLLFRPAPKLQRDTCCVTACHVYSVEWKQLVFEDSPKVCHFPKYPAPENILCIHIIRRQFSNSINNEIGGYTDDVLLSVTIRGTDVKLIDIVHAHTRNSNNVVNNRSMTQPRSYMNSF